MKFKYFSFVLIILSFFVSLFLWTRSSLAPGKGEVNKLSFPQGDQHSDDSKIRVVTWNIAFFYGQGSEGPGYKRQSIDYYAQRLDEASELLRSLRPDFILLQEVDLDSDRSFSVNQAKLLANKLGMHLAWAPSWENSYVPFPYFPVSRQFGKVINGGAILSKFPITQSWQVLFDHPQGSPWWYNWFYPHRYLQSVTVKFRGGQNLILFNVHLEAFDRLTRKLQVQNVIKELKSRRKNWILGGDFNMLPAGAKKRFGFEGYPEDDYRGDTSYNLIETELSVGDLLDVLTFPSQKPDRKLDYLFSPLKKVDCKVVQTTLSDHLPYLCQFDTTSL